ncbi:lipoprotein [Enterobacterales bacterium]|nr:lipoprotein [Enterobacterales bacterium]
MTRSVFPLLLILTLLGGCTPHPVLKTDNITPAQAWLQPGVQVNLPAPTLETPVNQQQLLSATVNGKTQSLLVLLSADGQSLQLAGLSPLGIRLFKLVYDQQGIHTEQAIISDKLPPAAQVLSDIMLSYWPVNRWQPLLPSGWTLKDEGMRRVLSDQNGRVVTNIDYLQRGSQRQPVSITQRAFHYQIAIQNVGN